MKPRKPLLVFMDSEYSQTAKNRFFGDIIELAAVIDPRVTAPKQQSFYRLISTNQELSSFVLHKCKITSKMLEGKPSFPVAFDDFVKWLNKNTKVISQKCHINFYPVLLAHGGMTSDFAYITKGLLKHNVKLERFQEPMIYVADTYELCCKLQKEGLPLLRSCRLSMSGLFERFCRGKEFVGQHQALRDVEAMIKIFTESSLSKYLYRLDIYPISYSFQTVADDDFNYSKKRDLMNSLPKLSKCENAMTLGRLYRNGYSWDSLKELYKGCISPLDFFNELKELGISRKAARAIVTDLQAAGVSCKGISNEIINSSGGEIRQLPSEVNCAAHGSTDIGECNDKHCVANECKSHTFHVSHMIPSDGITDCKYCRSDSGYNSIGLDMSESDTLIDLSFEMQTDPINSVISYGDFEGGEEILEWCEAAVHFSFLSKSDWKVSIEEADVNSCNHVNTGSDEEGFLAQLPEGNNQRKISKSPKKDSNEIECWDDDLEEQPSFYLKIDKVVPLGLSISDVFCDTVVQRTAICNMPLPRGVRGEKRNKKARWTPNRMGDN